MSNNQRVPQQQRKKQPSKKCIMTPKGGETLQYRVQATLLPDLLALKTADKLYGDYDDANNTATLVTSSDDVDFILVANHPPPGKENSMSHKSLWFRVGAAFSRFFNNSCRSTAPSQTIKEADFEKLRNQYFSQLQQKYGLTIAQVDIDNDNDGDTTSFYLIKGAFAHLGLMAQLMSYQWPLNDEVINVNDTGAKNSQGIMQQEDEAPTSNILATVRRASLTPSESGSEASTTVTVDKMECDVFKTFYFYKHGQERYHDYKHCQRRQDFDQAHRFDLMYHLLVGATVSLSRFLLNPWDNIFKKDETTQPQRNKRVSLMQLLADEVFDDWLVLHQPLRQNLPNNDNLDAENCCELCCYKFASCDCCCKVSTSTAIDDESFRNNLSNMWRTFWYRNCIESSDMAKRPDENDRSYLMRISTIRNALTVKQFGGATPDEGQLVKLWHIMPLGAIRRYFGEKIGFYFAWLEFFTFSLSLPAAIGAAFFFVALIYYAIQDTVYGDKSPSDAEYYVVNNSSAIMFSANLATNILAKACDNYATPAFAAIMLFWGASFVEFWHRRSCWYSWLWRVDNVEVTEFERPKTNQVGLAKRLLNSRYGGRYLLYIPSVVVTFFFCCLVFASVYFINVINVASFPFCIKDDDANLTTSTTTTTTTAVPFSADADVNNFTANAKKSDNDAVVCTAFDAARVIANSLSIMILDFCYTNIVYALTDLECHATKTEFTDALILKLFIFRFVNAYTVLFYVAFAVAPQFVVYPAEIVGQLNKQQRLLLYGCDGSSNCMALLTKQLLSCILTGPLIKSITAVVLPRVFFLLRLITQSFSKTKRTATKWRVNKVDPSPAKSTAANGVNNQRSPTLLPQPSVLPPIKHAISKQPTALSGDASMTTSSLDADLSSPGSPLDKLASEIEHQFEMPPLSTLDREEFTQSEYMDRIIMYGALLMFSVALPPAPLIALFIMRVDSFLDIGRMVSEYRRPLPFRVQDIGIWEKIVNFLTYCGILTNPLVVILASSWGSRLTMYEKFWCFLLFEHGMFFIRMLATSFIDEEPPELAKAKLRHKRNKDELMSALATSRQQQITPTLGRRSNSQIVQEKQQKQPQDSSSLYPKLPLN